MLRRLIICCLLLFPVAQTLKAQDYAGKDFWVALMDIDASCTPLPPPIPVIVALPTYYYDTTELFLSSEHAATVYIAIREGTWGDNGIKADFFDTIYLTPYQTSHVFLPVQLMCRYGYSDEVTRNGIHITSDSNIYVQATNRYRNVKGTSAVLPSNSIPYAPQYVISTNEATMQNNCNFNMGWNPSTCSEFVIVGIAYRSVIEIYSNTYSLYTGMKPYKPYTIELMQGETFFVVGSAIGGNKIDLTGSVIRSKTAGSKFAVFAGNKRTSSNLRNRNNVACNISQDHVYEQLYPVSLWGKSYSLLPFKNNPGGYFAKIVASEPNTNLYINGNFIKTLKASEYYTFNVNSDTANQISSDKPVSVVQFTKGGNCNEFATPKSSFGNLSMLSVASDEQSTQVSMVNNALFLKNWYLINKSSMAPETYVNVICKTIDTALFTFDNNKIPNNTWKQSAALKLYSYAQLPIDSANHLLKNDHGFKAYVYGYGNRQGFAYTAAAGVRPLNNQFIFDQTCKGDSSTFTAICSVDSFVNFQWRISKEPNLQTGKSFKYLFKDTGAVNITLYCTHKRTGQIDSIHQKTYISEANKTPVLCNDTLICGKVAFVLACRYLDRYKSYLWNGGHTYYAQYIKHPGLYWVKVSERNGCTYTDSVNIQETPKPLASFSLSDTLWCSNQNKPILFFNQSSSQDSIISQIWDFDDFNPIDTSADTLQHFFPKVGQHLVRLKVKTIKNCVHDTFAVVQQLQAPLANFTLSNFDSCSKNARVTLNNTTQIDTGHRWFKWVFSDSFVLSNANLTGPKKYKKAGEYSIDLIYENSNQCVDTMHKKLRIYPQAVAQFQTDKAVPCYGDSVKFTLSDSTQRKTQIFQWQFGDQSSSNLYAPTHLYSQNGLYLVKLKIISPESCNDSFQKTLRVSGSTRADFKIKDSAQCLDGNRFQISNLSSTDTGQIVFQQWLFSDLSTDTNYNIVGKTFNSYGKKRVRLWVRNTYNCQDSISKELMVIKGPLAKIQVNKATQCEGQQQFDFTGLNQTINDSLKLEKWLLENDSLFGTNKVSNYQFSALGNYSVRYVLENNKGCRSVAVQNVSVNPTPNAKFTLSDTAICLKQQPLSMLNQSQISKGSIQQYLWDFGDQSSSTLQNPLTKTYSSTGKYRIRLHCISDSSCSDSMIQALQIFPNANVQIKNIATVCLHDSSSFEAIDLSGNVNQYRWLLDQTDQSFGKMSRFQFSKPGTHQVLLITNTGSACKDSFMSTAYVYNLPEVRFRYWIQENANAESNVQFNSLSSSSLKHHWQLGPFGQSSLLDTSIVVKDSVGFMAILKVTDANQCSNTDSQYVFISGPLKFYTPNTFTPNGDGHNEGFGPVGIQFARNYVFTIYNRWGEIVYRSENLEDQWDGKYQDNLCPNGVYIYTIQLMDIYSKNKYFKGSVLLKW